MKKESFGAGATLRKSKSCGAGAMFMMRRAPEQSNLYKGSVALK